MAIATQSTWSWNDAPFSTKLDVRRFFSGKSHEESVSRLHFLADNHKRLGILTGPSGSGKSMVLEVAAQQFRKQNRLTVLTSVLGMDLDEFLWKICAGLGTNPAIDASPRHLWRDVDDQIAANRYQCLSTILLLDDVEDAETEVLGAISRLVQSDPYDQSRLTVVVSCESRQLHLLGKRLPDLSDLRVEIEPWGSDEVEEFVESALTASGCGNDVFTPNAIERLAELSGGIPRRAQQLAQLSLVAASAQDLDQVDEHILDAVHRELSTSS